MKKIHLSRVQPRAASRKLPCVTAMGANLLTGVSNIATRARALRLQWLSQLDTPDGNRAMRKTCLGEPSAPPLSALWLPGVTLAARHRKPLHGHRLGGENALRILPDGRSRQLRQKGCRETARRLGIGLS